MLPTDRALLIRIEALAIDPPGARLTFVDRLARDNGWSHPHATAVDREYRRFLFLAATAREPVTPSDAVDQAWHLHLAYSRSYWDDLCSGILGRPLHHGPTAGGPVEDDRYAAQYAATLDRYAATFGEHAPSSIWPPVDQRFADRFVRVAVPAPFTPRRIMGGIIVAVLVAIVAFMLTGSSTSAAMVGGAIAIGLVAAEIGSRSERRPHKTRKGSGDGADLPDGDSDGVGDGCGSGCGGGCGGD